MSSTKPSPVPPPKAARARRPERRRRLIALALLAALPALIVGLVVGARHEDSAGGAVEQFLAAWEKHDYGAMYAQLGPAAKRRTSPKRLLRTYQPHGAYWQARAQDGIQIAYAPEGGFRFLLSMASF